MDAESLIRTYQTGFYLCMAITIVGILLSLFFFFRFKIGNIWAIQSGKAQKKAVQELQEASRQDGRMRADEARYFTGQDDEEQALEITASLEPDVQETDVLWQNQQEAYGETEVLPQTEEFVQTTILNQNFAERKKFVVTQQVLLIHTEEKLV